MLYTVHMIAFQLKMTVSQLYENTTGEELMNWVYFFKEKRRIEEEAYKEAENKAKR